MDSTPWAYQGNHSTLTIQQWKLCGPLHDSGMIWSPANTVFHKSHPHLWTCYEYSHSVGDESSGVTQNTYSCQHLPMLRVGFHVSEDLSQYGSQSKLRASHKRYFVGVVVFSPLPHSGKNLLRRKRVFYPQPPQCETSSECSLFRSRCNGRIRL